MSIYLSIYLPAAEFASPHHKCVNRWCLGPDSLATRAQGAAAATFGGAGDPAPPEGG